MHSQHIHVVNTHKCRYIGVHIRRGDSCYEMRLCPFVRVYVCVSFVCVCVCVCSRARALALSLSFSLSRSLTQSLTH